jgi:hypothetical protein
MAVVWTVVSVVLSILLGWGLTLVGLNPPDFKRARFLCRISFISFAAWTVYWLYRTEADLKTRILTAIGVVLCSAIWFPICFIYIGNRERVFQSTRKDADPQEAIEAPPPASPRVPPILKVSLKFTPREETSRQNIALIIRNIGGSDASHVHINDFHVHQSTIRFPILASPIESTKATKPIRPYVVEAAESQRWDIALAMYNGTYGVHKGRTNDGYDYQGAATFYDQDGLQYEVLWIFTFYPHRFRQRELYHDTETPGEEREETGPYLIVSDATAQQIRS